MTDSYATAPAPFRETSVEIMGAAGLVLATFAEPVSGPMAEATPPSDGDELRGVPAVLLLHGTGSQRNEVGDLFALLAGQLAEVGVASLRIDFAGSVTSGRPEQQFTVSSELADARASVDWLSNHDGVDATRLAVLGFSQGGFIALLLAAEDPRLSALVSWSAGAATGREVFAGLAPVFEVNDDDPVLIDMGFRTFSFARQWWNEVTALNLSDPARRFGGAVLAVSGLADDIVDPSASRRLIELSPSTDTTLHEIDGADHIFNVFDPASTAGAEVRGVTTTWLAERLGAVPPA